MAVLFSSLQSLTNTSHLYHKPLTHVWALWPSSQLHICSAGSRLEQHSPFSRIFLIFSGLERGILLPQASQRAQLKCPQGYKTECGVLLITTEWWSLRSKCRFPSFMNEQMHSQADIQKYTLVATVTQLLIVWWTSKAFSIPLTEPYPSQTPSNLMEMFSEDVSLEANPKGSWC